jgi:hypothetical protein
MIELNCSYEESKKILELGYDFSKVCWKSLYEYRDQYNLNRTFIKIHIHGTHLSLASIEDEIKHRMSKYGIIDLVTPIIPKAALEKCLPAGLSFGFTEYGYLRYDYDVGEFQYYENPDYYYDDGKIHYSSKFEYEIFTWLHENYPEELKAKFDEVMG